MSLWNNKEHRTCLDDAEDLAHPTDCGPWTRWLMGIAVPMGIIIYSAYSIYRGTINLFGRGNSMTVTGEDVRFLGAAYIALAAFLHLHFCWSAHATWWQHVSRLKVLSLLIFLPCLLKVLYHQLGF